MEGALTSEPKVEKTSQATSVHASESILSSEHEQGALAGMPLFLQASFLYPNRLGIIQRKDEDEESENQEADEPLVQTKLVIGQPGDAYEQEADEVAGAVAQGSASQAAEPAGVSEQVEDDRVQRMCSSCGSANCSCDSAPGKEGIVQRKTAPAAPSTHPPIESNIQVPDSGAPLSASVREKVEPMLGADLSRVRVHTGSSANDAAKDLHAKAFTHKNHIWLGPNQNPDDLELMAHEATHVVQQDAATDSLKTIQRAPADYQHPEDGGGVERRMQAHVREALGLSEDEAIPAAPARGGAPAASAGSTAPAGSAAPAPSDPQATRAAGDIDRAELQKKKGELQSEAEPDVNRPAQQQPQVEEAASATQEEADSPSEPLAEGEGQDAAKAEGEAEQGKATGEAEQVASMADQAFASADSQPVPSPAAPVMPPPPVAPVDSAGMPLEADPQADFQIADLADRAQVLREEGHRLRLKATEERGNAEILRGNIELIRGGISQSEQGVEKSNDHLSFRQQTVTQAREALAVSEQKASMVAEQAPDFSSKSDEGKQESGPMASEASQMSAENAANTPSDPEAGAEAQEQGGKINQAGSDIATTDDAVTQTKTKAASLGQDAARATEINTQTQGKIESMDETLAQTGERLSQMGEQNTQASAQVESMASQPDRLAAQAAAIDEQGIALIQSSFDIESQLQQTQTSYEQGMKSVPAVKMLPEAEDQTVQRSESAEDQLVQLTPEDGTPTVGPPPADAVSNPDDTAPDGNLPPEDIGPEAEPPTEAASQPATSPAGEGRYEDRANVDLTGSVTKGLPSWMTGVDPVSEQQRDEAMLAEQQRRQNQIDQINERAKGNFENLSATDKMGIALSLTGQNLFGSVGKIKWPGFGHLAAGLIDPRGPLMGVVSGLSMMLSGGANLLSGEQWSRDPLGNLLKSAADIATGLTIILGSITALAGVIIAIMTAITILSFGTAAPITGPVIGFCATVMTTVGGWTIAVGKVALILQALVFIKNLIDAATAKTAEDLQNQSDQMTQDVSNAGNVVLQIGMAKLAQMGGRNLQSQISAAGGARAFARGMPAAFAGGVRSAGGAVVRGVQAAGRGIARGARAVGRGTVGGARAIGRRLRSGLRGGAAESPVGLSRPLQIRGQSHSLSIRRLGNRLVMTLCSDNCGELIAKARRMADNLPEGSPARAKLEGFIKRATRADARINANAGTAAAESELQQMRDLLQDIQRAHPEAVDPNVVVPPAAPTPAAEPTPAVEPPAAAPAEARPGPTGPVEAPPGTQYKEPIPGLSGKEGAKNPPSWVKNEGYGFPRVGEAGEDFATRVLNAKYGQGNWSRGPGTEFNKIQKWADRNFQ
jgi:hypothetical protein